MEALINLTKIIKEELENSFEDNKHAWELWEALYDTHPVYFIKECAPAFDLRGLDEVDCIWKLTE